MLYELLTNVLIVLQHNRGFLGIVLLRLTHELGYKIYECYHPLN